MGSERVLKLEVFPAEGEPFQRTIAGVASVAVGRSSSVDLMVPDRMLSRRHARLYLDGGDWLVEDLGSHNGTFLNGSRVESPARLKDGDVLALGGSSVTVTLASESSGPVRAIDGTHSGTKSGATVFRPAVEVLRQGAMDHGGGRETDKEALRASLERLRVLNEVHQALARPISLKELLDLILDRAFSHLHPEEGAVYLRGPDGEYRCAASRSARPTAVPVTVPRSARAGGGGERDGGAGAGRPDRRPFRRRGEHPLGGRARPGGRPLQDAKGVMGLIVLVSTLSVRQFTEEDMELLVSLGAVAALRIRNVALTEEAAEARRLEELALARRIQLALLPDRLPELKAYDVHGGNLPSRGVSGDYYEVIERKDGTEAVLWIVDVCGKGMSAALLTASLEALAAGLIEEGLPPEEVFRRVSRLLYQRTPPEKYATAFMAVIEVATGKVAYTNAGHCPSLLVRRGGGCEWLKTTGIPLGLMEDWTYARDETVLEPGDLLMLYTDGITEAMDPTDEEFGTDRLAQVASEQRGEPLKEIAQRLESEMDRFVKGVPYADDRTSVIIRRRPTTP